MWWCGVCIKFRNSYVRIVPTQFECSAWGQVSESNGISHMKLRGVRPILGQNLIYYQKWSFKERRRGKFQMYMTTNSDHFYYISGPNLWVELSWPVIKIKNEELMIYRYVFSDRYRMAYTVVLQSKTRAKCKTHFREFPRIFAWHRWQRHGYRQDKAHAGKQQRLRSKGRFGMKQLAWNVYLFNFAEAH